MTIDRDARDQATRLPVGKREALIEFDDVANAGRILIAKAGMDSLWRYAGDQSGFRRLYSGAAIRAGAFSREWPRWVANIARR